MMGVEGKPRQVFKGRENILVAFRDTVLSQVGVRGPEEVIHAATVRSSLQKVVCYLRVRNSTYDPQHFVEAFRSV